MKKVLSIFALVAIMSLAACGGKKGGSKVTAPTDDIPKVKVIDSMGSTPAWIELGDDIGKRDGKKVIFFTGYGESLSKDTAKESAQLNAAGAAATAIKAVATKQVAKAWEAIGTGDNEQKEQVMKGLEAISARNVNVAGLRRMGVYWRQVVKPKIVNAKLVGWTKPLFEYYVRYSMDYNTFKMRRDGAIDKVKKATKLNQRQKKLYKDMESKLAELDESGE